MRTHTTALLAALLVGTAPVALAQSGPAHTQTRDAGAQAQERMGESPDKPLAAALEARVTDGTTDDAVASEFGEAVAKAVRHAYASRNFEPVWTESGAKSFREEVRHLFEHGIAVDDVFSRDLDDLIDTRFGDTSPETRAEADTRLVLAALRAAKAVGGDLSDARGVDLDADAPKRSGLADFLVSSGNGAFARELEAFQPAHPQYAKLKAALADYRALKESGGWAAIPSGGIIEEGDTDERVSAIRNRLALEGFEAEADSEDPDLFNASTVDALKAFQTRHGIKADGVVGPNTLDAMNESVESKIARIAETLHRWREHGDLGERYILANIPSYSAEGWNGGEREIRMKTVVGKARHATPTFSDQAEYIVVNPKWYVPKSIARRQKLDDLQADPTYANRKNFEVVNISTGQAVDPASVDWNAPGVFDRYRLVQQPGEKNALGQMKIIFPNQYSVYLHDTPTEHLFDRAQRAFSSGCVRLERPFEMAKWVAGGDPDITPEEFQTQLDSGERERMYLGEELPVHITYHTVTVNDEGDAVFHRDVYDRLDDIEQVERMAKLSGSPRSTSSN